MRPLTLHASALNDEEYDFYTSSILDLALYGPDKSESARDDTFYEQITVSVRETRAWLRGRYPLVAVATIDAILKIFSPKLSQGDILSGGQFFAALRLVVHAQNGRDPDRALAFVQARPNSSSAGPSTSPLKGSASDIAAPPQIPRRSVDSSSYTPSSTISEPPPNPFSYESGQQPPIHPSQRLDNNKTTTTTPHSPNNPFVKRSKSISSRSEDGSTKLPPLPPRKPPSTQSPIPPPPPRHVSSSHSQVSSPTPVRLHPPAQTGLRTSPSSTPHPHPHPHSHATPPPIPPPLKLKPLPVTHVTSTLMKQSLQASKAAQTMKKAEEQLEKERVLQVLRSSAVSGAARRQSRSPSKRVPAPSSAAAKSDSGTSASWSGSEERNSLERERERPPLPQRRHQRQAPPPPPPHHQHSSSLSATSLEQLALAVPPYPHSSRSSNPHTPTYTSSPFDSPTKPTLDLPLAPPTHPDRKPSFTYHMDGSMSSTSPTSASAKSPFRRNLESFEAVYGAASSASPSPSPISPGPATATATYFSLRSATPTTPTQLPLTSSSDSFPHHQQQQRMHRSKSLHHPTPPSSGGGLPPPPPPKHGRKRPESIQVLSNGEVLFGSGGPSTTTNLFDANNALKNSITQFPPPLGHKRSSHSHSHSHSTSAFSGLGDSSTKSTSGGGESITAATIQRKLVELQLRAQENALPVFEKARYKAEAGLSRRGFIQGSSTTATALNGSSSSTSGMGGSSRSRRSGSMSGDREGLLTSTEYLDDNGGEDENEDGSSPSVDSGDEDRGSERKKGSMAPVRVERDELKWPVGPGEGWKMLR